MSSLSSNAVSEPIPAGTPAALPPPRPMSLWLGAGCFAAGVATFINMYCTQSMLPVLDTVFGVSHVVGGLTVTAPLIATAIGAPLVGVISDRLGRKRLILGAILLLFIPTLLAGHTTSIDQLILCRFVQGLLLPFIFTVTVAYIGDETTGPDTVRLSGAYMAGSVLGGFSGRWIAGTITSWLGWRDAFDAIALLTGLLGLIVLFCLPAERRFVPIGSFTRALHAFPLHLANKGLRATYVAGFGVLFSFVAVFTFVNFRLAAAPFNMGPAALGDIFVVYLGGVFTTPIGARLAVRYGRRRIFAIAAPVSVLGLLITLAPGLPMILLGLLVMAGATFVEQTLATAYVGAAAREAKSIAVGLYVTFYYAGGGLGGFIPALPYHAFGWAGCVALVAAVQLVLLGIVFVYWRPQTAGAD